MTQYKLICSEVEGAVTEVADFIRKEFAHFDQSMVEVKGLHDLVSYVDKESERMLVSHLRKIAPDAGILAEEGTTAKSRNKLNWVIDPLDGTTNFTHGLSPFAISIGLTNDGDPVAGVILDVMRNEMFTAWKGGGAWLNGKEIRVSSVPNLTQSLIATGFPYHDFSRLDDYLKCFDHFCRTTHGLRRIGSAAIDLAYVACGRFEAFWEYGLNPWDITAGIIIVREAGGHACDFRGEEANLMGKEILATNALIFEEFLQNVSKFMVR